MHRLNDIQNATPKHGFFMLIPAGVQKDDLHRALVSGSSFLVELQENYDSSCVLYSRRMGGTRNPRVGRLIAAGVKSPASIHDLCH
jgi:hypothetical protein